MTETETQEAETYFAFGDDCVEDCACPAVSAGYSPHKTAFLLEFVEMYDDIVRDEIGTSFGLVPQSMAKNAWMRTISIYETDHPQIARSGKQVADQLGWL